MTCASTRPRRHVIHRIALVGLLGAALMPRPAAGQIPGVPRRVQDAATRAARVDTQPNPCVKTVVFDSVVLELTSPRLGQVLKGLRARQQVLNGRRGAPSWNAMVTQRDAAANAAADLLERKGPEMDAYRERLNRITQCRDSAFNERRQANQQASMQRVMSDPDFMRQTAELSQRVAEAQQKGDTAEMMRLSRQAAALLEGPTREDTLAVDRHCGRLPAPPASIAQLDSLRALQDSLNAQLRRREQEADSVAIGASGLTARQMAMGQERAEMFLAQAAAEGALCGFSPAERAALKAEQAELDELL
jgi:hypothetical protein